MRVRRSAGYRGAVLLGGVCGSAFGVGLVMSLREGAGPVLLVVLAIGAFGMLLSTAHAWRDDRNLQRLLRAHHREICPRCRYPMPGLARAEAGVHACAECGVRLTKIELDSAWANTRFGRRASSDDIRAG